MNIQRFSLKSIGKELGHLLHRFHIIIFFLVVSAGFGFAVLHINSMLEETATDDTYSSSIDAGSIDAATLDRINDLQKSSQVVSLPRDEGSRANPFGE